LAVNRAKKKESNQKPNFGRIGQFRPVGIRQLNRVHDGGHATTVNAPFKAPSWDIMDI